MVVRFWNHQSNNRQRCRTGNVARTCQLIYFLSKFTKYFFIFLWVNVCIKVGERVKCFYLYNCFIFPLTQLQVAEQEEKKVSASTRWFKYWFSIQIVTRMLFRSPHTFFVWFSHHHSKTRPFYNQTCLDHSNIILIWYSDGYCLSFRTVFWCNY